MKCSGLGHTFPGGPGGVGFTIPFSSQQVDSMQCNQYCMYIFIMCITTLFALKG